MVIEKPMLEVRTDEDLVDPAIEIGEPCIPDFVLQAEAAPAGDAAVVIVETMGFASENYRARKDASHKIMASTLRAPIIVHDFHLPEKQSQAERDRVFWATARMTVIRGKTNNMPVPSPAKTFGTI